MAGSLQISQSGNSEAIVLQVFGEVDLYTSPQLRKQLLAAFQHQTKALIVDLSGVPYMDSSGIATLVEGLQQAEKSGREFFLCGLNPMVQKVFELSRLDTVFTIYADFEEISSRNKNQTDVDRINNLQGQEGK